MDTSNLDFGLHIETARLQEFLAQLLRSQETIHKRQDDLASSFDELLKKLASEEHGVNEQQQALQKLQNETERLSERLDELDKLRIREKMERYDTDHNEIKSFQSQISLLDSKVRSAHHANADMQNKLCTISDCAVSKGQCRCCSSIWTIFRSSKGCGNLVTDNLLHRSYF